MNQKYFLLLNCILIHFATVSFATFSEYVTVLAMYLKNPAEMGEIAPFSCKVGKELAKHIAKNSKDVHGIGKKYLEAGGGAGSISVCIAAKLRPQDHLDVIEINSDLCKILRKRLRKYKNVSVQCCSILDWHPDYKYDAIISTLPFLSLGIEFTKQAIPYFQSVANEKCIFSCVEYPIVTKIRSMMLNLNLKKIACIDVQRYMDLVRKKYLKDSATIYYNIPPTNVYHMCFGS